MALTLGACSSAHLSADAPRQPSLRVADAAMASGAPELALRIADLLLAKHPDTPAALTARGDALYAMGQRDQARNAYRAAIAIDPTLASAQLGLGRSLARSDPRAAEAAFLQALTQDPDNVAALNDLGVVRDMQGRNVDAQEAYRKALAVAPTSMDVRVNLGTSLALSGNRPEAVSILRGVAANPDAAQAWRKQLAAGLNLAGDAAWAQAMLQADGTPAREVPPTAVENVRIASVPTAIPDAKQDSLRGVTESRQVAAAAISRPRDIGKGSDVPDDVVAMAPAGIRAPLIEAAPLTKVISADMPSIASMSGSHTPVITPVVTTSTVPASIAGTTRDTVSKQADKDVPAAVQPATASISRTNNSDVPSSATPATYALVQPEGTVAPLHSNATMTSSPKTESPATAINPASVEAATPKDPVRSESDSSSMPRGSHVVTSPSAAETSMQVAALRPATPDAVTALHDGRSGPYVQVASLMSAPDAAREWRRLEMRLSPLLADREPVITQADVKGRTYWRLRTFGFASAEAANELCSRIKAAGLGCWSGKGL